ncbi:MAG: hypothetical protein GXY76_21265 [Chloroflexi bacterium]|nr:hypothetical protein [Chloroflexota bacterium]
MAENLNPRWPVLNRYDADHLARIALPIGGLGTGTISLGGRGDLHDWEVVNRPAKGFTPNIGRQNGPFFAVHAQPHGSPAFTRLLEGPLPLEAYEASHGSRALNHGLPRFRRCEFAAAYPFGQVLLSDPDLPLGARLEAWNPFIPGDADSSGIPVAALRYVLTNRGAASLTASICGTLPNFIGQDGHSPNLDWLGQPDFAVGQQANRNAYREADGLRGMFLWSEGVDPAAETWGTLALTVLEAEARLSHRAAWAELSWGDSLLDFWDDFCADGQLDPQPVGKSEGPVASLCAQVEIPAGESRALTFLLAWHFPNRRTWHPRRSASACCCGEPDLERVGNYYATQYADAWDVAAKTAPRLPALEEETLRFVTAFCDCDLPDVIKEAALDNASTLRTQTCFRTEDGRFYGWEGSCDTAGCCFGSCTHVWNYEATTPFLFADLARSMREVEFAHATDARGLMSFRVHLPLHRAQEHGRAAADGQMGCLIKLYREWQLSGDDEWLRALWPHARRALEFCWIEGGWDADQDGVMEGCQHNTMDVEYYGPNPQMGSWYLGALCAAEAMARYLGEDAFAAKCHDLCQRGRAWLDENLFNGEYYEHEVRPPRDESAIAPGLRVGMGSADLADPALQLGAGCLVDQLAGQYLAHVCGLGYLLDPDNVQRTLQSVMRYNWRESFHDHFNHLRSFVLGDESALLMATYPRGRRPVRPFPYYNEVMTGFEYCAAVGMLYEGLTEDGLKVIEAIRDRYDGRKRSPFDEAECGHHYARAMAAWAAVLAWTGFQYSAVNKTMTFAPVDGTWFWSNGAAWGTVQLKCGVEGVKARLTVLHGALALQRLVITGVGAAIADAPRTIRAGKSAHWQVKAI